MTRGDQEWGGEGLIDACSVTGKFGVGLHKGK